MTRANERDDALRAQIVEAAVELRTRTRARYEAKVKRAALRKEYLETEGHAYSPGYSDDGASIDDAQWDYDQASQALAQTRQRLHRLAQRYAALRASQKEAN